MLDVAQTFYKMTGQMCLEGIKLGYSCNKAVLRGAWQGSKNYGNKVLALGKCCKDLAYKAIHPIETTRILAPKIQRAAKRFGQYLVECSDAQEKWRNQDHNPHLYYWHIRTNEEYLTIKQQRREWLDETIKDGHQMLKNTANFAYDAGLEGCIEKGTEVATEMALSYATGKAVGSLAQAGASSFANVLDELSELQYIHQIPTTMGTMQGYVALEGTELARAAAALRVLSDEFGAAGDALGKVGSAGNLFNDLVSNEEKNSIFDYPGDSFEVAEAKLIEIQDQIKLILAETKTIDSIITGLSEETRNHILADHHRWEALFEDPIDWNSIAKVMTKVMKDGTLGRYKKTGKRMYLNIGDETVEVIFQIVKGEIRIGNAWVTR